jgi:paraquat-inducible protein B
MHEDSIFRIQPEYLLLWIGGINFRHGWKPIGEEIMSKKKWVIAAVLVMIIGCQEKEYTISVRYKRIGSLQKGSPVVMKENQRVGQVAGIEISGTDQYTATLSIDPEKKDQITEFTIFKIVQDPGKENRSAIEIITAREGGSMLPSGSVVDGLDPEIPSLLETLKKEVTQKISHLQKHFSDLSKDWNDFLQELRQIPEKQAVKELEKELEKLGREMKESSQEWKEKIQKELLPELRKEMNRLKEKLQEKGQEEDMRPLEIQMDKLQKI